MGLRFADAPCRSPITCGDGMEAQMRRKRDRVVRCHLGVVVHAWRGDFSPSIGRHEIAVSAVDGFLGVLAQRLAINCHHNRDRNVDILSRDRVSPSEAF